jgi:geranylgeranyl pyrophosphate synthase
MIGGQILDLDAQKKLFKNSNTEPNADELANLHKLKTAALIRAATEGAAIIARSDADTRMKMRNFGECLGFCFQIADDIHDFNPAKPEATGFPKLIGLEKTRHLLEEQTGQALNALSGLGPGADRLRTLVNFNLKRLN